MNREIAKILMSKIQDLPFIDLIGGLVQVITHERDQDDMGNKRKQVFPAAYDIFNASMETPGCFAGPARDMVPDSSRKSIIYFEDRGIGKMPGQVRPGMSRLQSNIRLVAWLNRDRLIGDSNKDITTYVMQALISRLSWGNPINNGNIQRLSCSASGMPIMDFSIFSKYTYDESLLQFLMPPFQCLAIDLSCKYQVADKCLIPVNFEGGTVC